MKDSREIVVFSIAINDYYKTKDGEKKNEATFFNCSYWISINIAKSLFKGGIVTLYGRVGVNAYKTMDGEFHANLTFHVNNVKIVASNKKGGVIETAPSGVETTEDLPF